jgi:hypothetical protein
VTVIHADGLDDTAETLAAAALTLARRFSAGATLWCVAPGAGHHARHVAVEFVHPVVVGTRSLPALAVDSDETLRALPALVRAGDVLLLAGDADDRTLADLSRRCAAWGATAIQIAAPNASIGTGAPDVVLTYHLLWELTHVALGHPGLMEGEATPACADDICVTCSDDARLAEVRGVIDADTVLAISDGELVEVDVSLVPAVHAGDLLLVHAGLALTVLDEVPIPMPERTG